MSARLKTLVEAGLLDRVPYEPDRHEYRLTQMGRELFPAIVTLMQWGDRYLADPDGPPILFRHKGCGQISESYVACRNCGGDIDYHTVTPEPGPSFGNG
ncbi:winged helix-turn-helix transcriptional regulator [Kibdelosporangium aridum]|uniref:winged helix-turn-helix transcriptional regulator n=1 Tax=Kibdelosporangium aridum TaxID=2030 RepID=UPI0035ECE790